jgi:hypothetical protein
MPRMFDAENPEHQQQIRDLAALPAIAAKFTVVGEG